MLTYQKLIMALDKAHISKNEGFYEFNLGSVVKDSTLKGLFVRIQKSDSTDVKLGKHKDGRYVIVIFTNELPERLKIDSMLSWNKALMSDFVQCLQTYYDDYREQTSTDSNTKQERIEQLSNKQTFEESYDKLIAAIEEKMVQYNAAVKELEKTEKFSVNIIASTSAVAAKAKLKEDYFGKTDREFVKKMLKLPEAEFVAYLDKEVQKKVEKRLENYYDQKF